MFQSYKTFKTIEVARCEHVNRYSCRGESWASPPSCLHHTLAEPDAREHHGDEKIKAAGAESKDLDHRAPIQQTELTILFPLLHPHESRSVLIHSIIASFTQQCLLTDLLQAHLVICLIISIWIHDLKVSLTHLSCRHENMLFYFSRGGTCPRRQRKVCQHHGRTNGTSQAW